MSTVSLCVATIPPRARLLEERCLASVRAQTRQPDEVIVMVDEAGEGAGPTRNRAWRAATSTYCAFVDDDDELEPYHLELLVGLLDRKQADLAFPWFWLIGPDGEVIEDDKLACPVDGELRTPLGVSFGPEQAQHLHKHAFIPATVVVRRSMLELVGGYPAHDTDEYAERRGCEDWAMLVRMLDAGGYFVHMPARTWRLHLGVGVAGASWREAAGT